jgi:hypothetical protein
VITCLKYGFSGSESSAGYRSLIKHDPLILLGFRSMSLCEWIIRMGLIIGRLPPGSSALARHRKDFPAGVSAQARKIEGE